MADYKELLRKAVEALPENNGAARRAVYEKARSALVAQLRGLNPPLPAREITQHRLQLEDCIRQVEQEASELVISGLRQTEDLPQIAPPLHTPQLAAPSPAATSHAPNGHAAGGHAAAAPHAPGNHAAPAPGHAGNGASAPVSRRTAPANSAARPSAPARPPSRLSSKAKPPAASIEEIIAEAGEEFPEDQAEGPVFEAPRRPEVAARGQHGNGHQSPAGRLPPRARRVIEPDPQPEPEPEVEDVVEDDFIPIQDAEIEAAPDVEADYDSDEDVHDDPLPMPPPIPRNRQPEAQAHRGSRPLPAIVARAEAIKAGRGNTAAFAVPANKPYERQRRGPVIEPRREVAQGGAQRAPALARQQVTYVEPSGAVTNLREVEVPESANDPQSAIDRAIATLDREARGEAAPQARPTVVEMPQPVRVPAPTAELHEEPVAPPQRDTPKPAETGFVRAPIDEDRGGGSAITIFLLIFLVLLIGSGGVGLWAWHEGYIDFASMFGKTQTNAEATVAPAKPAPTESAPAKPANPVANTVSTPTSSEPPAAQLKTDDRLNGAAQAPAEQTAAAPAAQPSPQVEATPQAPQAEANAPTNGEVKSEDRLTEAAQNAAGNEAPAIAPNPAAAAGSQSLLLEASDDGTTGAVPFSGTVEWTEGKDETGQPTLLGKANIPARNLGVTVLIRKNSDPTLPASHLMEINFKVSDTFIGGSIAGLPGVLLKNEELVQGSPLVGASARVVGNSFLFALSASAEDAKANVDLLTSRKWIDLAIIYATGKRAIITLEKDDKAQALFSKVFADWSKPAG